MEQDPLRDNTLLLKMDIHRRMLEERGHTSQCELSRPPLESKSFCQIVFFGILSIVLSLRSLCIVLFRYFTNVTNGFDVIKLWLNFSCFRAVAEWEGTDGQRAFLAASGGLQWFKIVWSLRVFEVFGPRIYAVLYALRDNATIAFLGVVAFVFAGFVHAFYVLGTQPGPPLLYAAFLPVFRLMFTGDYDLSELEGVDAGRILQDALASAPGYVDTWFFLVALLVKIPKTIFL